MQLVRSASVIAFCALLAAPAFAFVPSTLPASLQIRSPAAFLAGQSKLPVGTMIRQAKKPAAVSMELIGKRVVALMMISVMEKLFERTLTSARLRALKNDLRGIKASTTLTTMKVEKTKTEKKPVSDLEVIKNVQQLNKLEHPPGSLKETEGTQTTNAAGAPVMNTDSVFGFLMVSVPLLGLLISMISRDQFVDSLSVSAASACFLILMVDLAADTPSTDLSASIKRSLPRSVKRLIT